MDNRGSAYIKLRNGKSYHYTIPEREDGYYYFVSDPSVPTEYSINKKLTSTRNWMSAESKAHDEFKKLREKAQQEGIYKHSYSTAWTEPSSSSHNYDYEKKPSEVTHLKKYGSSGYQYLEFQKHENIHKANGRNEFDTTYYVIGWEPTSPITFQIKKTVYKGGNQISEKKLSKVVSENDKIGIKKLVQQFRKLHKKEKDLVSKPKQRLAYA